MTFNEILSELKSTFPEKSWAYSVQHNGVQIGFWTGAELKFRDGYSTEHLTELRVFSVDGNTEIRVVKGAQDFMLRNSTLLNNTKAFEDKYIMYGERTDCSESDDCGNIYTALKENRGSKLWFPAKISKDFRNLKLGIRNFYRYNPVTVLGVSKNYDDDLGDIGKGAFEFYDYAFTGFYYADDRKVDL